MFGAWPDLLVRLDIWHFMRRIARGVTTDCHPLYGPFMSKLSACIFKWCPDDVKQLQKAKRAELAARHITDPSDHDVQLRMTKKELSLHCQRTTRGTTETTYLLKDLLTTYDGDAGKDTLGTPLLDSERIWEIWKIQEKHVRCIQDPHGVQLYTRTGTLTKGGVQLPMYRCARGSTSLESFHLHLARFIPGKYIFKIHDYFH
jgi:hypothetical protein